MKPLSLFSALAIGVVVLAQPLLSQTPQAAPARPARTMVQELQAMKDANKKLLEQQAAAMLKLDDMQKEAAQLRIMVRRT